ncbi:MAG: hypothetical protein ACREVL_11170 [Solimonas sp.]
MRRLFRPRPCHPVFTALIAGLALGEQIEAYHGFAFALIVSGIVFANLRWRRAAA